MTKKKIDYKLKTVNKVYSSDDMKHMVHCENAEHFIRTKRIINDEWLKILKEKHIKYHQEKEWERFLTRYNKMLISIGERTKPI